MNYKYNGDNLLTERTENGITTRYYYDGDQMIAEGTVTNGVAAHKASYLRGNQLVARVDATGSKAYYVHNGHGDVVELRDANGNVVNQYAYDLWGNPTTILKGVDNPFLYSGEYWDESVKLQYLRARWYDPSMGRFINEDTYEGQLDNPLSLNLYTYVENNPLKFVDPSGHAQQAVDNSGGGSLFDTSWIPWNLKIAANWTINEMKWMWQAATTQGERNYWGNQADSLRSGLREKGYSNSEIMQSSDDTISRENVYRISREAHPFLAFIEDFVGAALDYPGEAATIKFASSFYAARVGKKFEKELNFTTTTTKRMEQAGRYVPIQTLKSAIRFGQEMPDPQGTSAKMYYTVMYKNQKEYNLEVLYNKSTNTVLHFMYTRDSLGPLQSKK